MTRRLCRVHQKENARRRHTAPTAATSCSSPSTLEVCVIATSRVRAVSARSISRASIRPSASGGTSVSVITPLLASSESGRSTELCSISVDTTWSPVRTAP